MEKVAERILIVVQIIAIIFALVVLSFSIYRDWGNSISVSFNKAMLTIQDVDILEDEYIKSHIIKVGSTTDEQVNELVAVIQNEVPYSVWKYFVAKKGEIYLASDTVEDEEGLVDLTDETAGLTRVKGQEGREIEYCKVFIENDEIEVAALHEFCHVADFMGWYSYTEEFIKLYGSSVDDVEFSDSLLLELYFITDPSEFFAEGLKKYIREGSTGSDALNEYFAKVLDEIENRM